MTSVPARNGTLGPTVDSLHAQTVPPDEIRLYIESNCTEVDGVHIVRTEDRGPITKLSAIADRAVSDDALIVTVDDDIVYAPQWLETLLFAAKATPLCAIGYAGWNVADFLRDPSAGTYLWAKPGPCDVLEGWAGIVYRKSFFDSSVFAPPPEFRFVDDVWIAGHLRRRGIARRLIRPRLAQERPGALPGLHNRPDFLALNRQAAISLFSESP